MRYKYRLAIIATTLTLLVSSVGEAAIPNRMTVQGNLTDSAGVPLPAGFKQLTFRIYDMQSGGVMLWQEVQTIATNSEGLWTATLGTGLPLDASYSPPWKDG